MTEAENQLRIIRNEIALRKRKLEASTYEAFLLRQALYRREAEAEGCEKELAVFEAVEIEAMAKVAAERAEWLRELMREPKPLRITHFEEAEAVNENRVALHGRPGRAIAKQAARG